MQFKLATFTTLIAAATLAAATATPIKRFGGSDGPKDQCNTGSLLCCNTVQPASSQQASNLLGLLGVVVGDLTTKIGITCSPVQAIGIGSNSCAIQPVCCKDNSFSGVIAVGCTPINANV
ncbi:hypothetical protein D9619_007110 [Psilocybe cf. subviscida]|uniref:Hydrophobin n=1 Tax=Psilocybe cf. subviscida TaxID=2480587 RepID=A0A8H5B231_9AGAR|nr:hypothetical protein D9619_007110 [Psilocybe cf. subviscida]